MYGGWEKENESMNEDNCKVFKLTEWKDTAKWYVILMFAKMSQQI